jgi:hypothetical protein
MAKRRPGAEFSAYSTSARLIAGEQSMDEYQVTYSNGEVVVIEAWTPELALAIAEEEADENGRQGLSAVSVELLTAAPVEP